MSTLENTITTIDRLPAAQTSTRRRLDALDHAVSALSERLNPILVKEARQALKSKQFSITFALVLACGWLWSMFGLAMFGPGLAYSSNGPGMFVGYYIVLAFPLLVIVPFSAFRSLASEREDGTYELLSITTLKARQIIGGKLGSAVLQMLVYFSAISPCLAFTYMLRGLDFPSIILTLFYTVLASLGLAVIGLLLATVTEEKHWQVVLSVALIFALGLMFFMACTLVTDMVSWSRLDFQDQEFWIANGAILTAYGCYFALAYCLAATQLMFSSENRSTVPRIIMLVHQLMFVGWMAWAFSSDPDDEYVYAYLTVLGLHWYVMGVFLTGESSALSPRVKRALPQSFLGRAFLTWFNPGSGTGYLFSIANLSSGALIGVIGFFVWYYYFFDTATLGLSVTDPNALICFTALGFCYVVLYLGAGRLLTMLVSKAGSASMLLNVLIHFLLLLAGCAIPVTIHLMSPSLRNDYSLIEFTNPVWTLIEVVDGPMMPEQLVALLIGLPLLAGAVLLLNLPSVAAEVRQVRIAKPRRMVEEDAAIDAALHPAEPVHISPWD